MLAAYFKSPAVLVLSKPLAHSPSAPVYDPLSAFFMVELNLTHDAAFYGRYLSRTLPVPPRQACAAGSVRPG